jgi:hypothetical protein
MFLWCREAPVRIEPSRLRLGRGCALVKTLSVRTFRRYGLPEEFSRSIWTFYASPQACLAQTCANVIVSGLRAYVLISQLGKFTVGYVGPPNDLVYLSA